MHKIITFLGIHPQTARYNWQGTAYEGQVFAQALSQFWDFDVMLVLTTAGAEKNSWPVVASMNDPRIRKISIPDGNSTDQMWQIFDLVIENVEEGDTVTFDITHAFRSLPFLAFMFAAYLKTARQVKIKAVLYGALEMSRETGEAPVLDLTEFISMLDWITATEQFVQTGDARRLSGLLEEHANGKESSKTAAQTLRDVSRAAFLCQPFSLMDSASQIEPDLRKAASDFSGTSRPFWVLSETIIQNFSGFAQHGQRDILNTLKIEYQLIEWYFEHGQLIQALALAREWMIDLVGYRLNLPLDFGYAERTSLEKALSGIIKVGKEQTNPDTGEKYTFTVSLLNSYGTKIYTEWPEQDLVLLKKIWGMVPNFRNRLGHAEHQQNPMNLTKNLDQAKDIRTNLAKAAEQWGVLP